MTTKPKKAKLRIGVSVRERGETGCSKPWQQRLALITTTGEMQISAARVDFATARTKKFPRNKNPRQFVEFRPARSSS